MQRSKFKLLSFPCFLWSIFILSRKAAWHLGLPFYSPPYSVLNLTASIDWAPFQRGCVCFCQINYKHSSLTSNCGNRWLPFCSRCNFGWIRAAVCQLILASALLDSPVNCACSLLCASRCWRKGLVEEERTDSPIKCRFSRIDVVHVHFLLHVYDSKLKVTIHVGLK